MRFTDELESFPEVYVREFNIDADFFSVHFLSSGIPFLLLSRITVDCKKYEARIRKVNADYSGVIAKMRGVPVTLLKVEENKIKDILISVFELATQKYAPDIAIGHAHKLIGKSQELENSFLELYRYIESIKKNLRQKPKQETVNRKCDPLIKKYDDFLGEIDKCLVVLNGFLPDNPERVRLEKTIDDLEVKRVFYQEGMVKISAIKSAVIETPMPVVPEATRELNMNVDNLLCDLECLESFTDLTPDPVQEKMELTEIIGQFSQLRTKQQQLKQTIFKTARKIYYGNESGQYRIYCSKSGEPLYFSATKDDVKFYVEIAGNELRDVVIAIRGMIHSVVSDNENIVKRKMNELFKFGICKFSSQQYEMNKSRPHQEVAAASSQLEPDEKPASKKSVSGQKKVNVKPFNDYRDKLLKEVNALILHLIQLKKCKQALSKKTINDINAIKNKLIHAEKMASEIGIHEKTVKNKMNVLYSRLEQLEICNQALLKDEMDDIKEKTDDIVVSADDTKEKTDDIVESADDTKEKTDDIEESTDLKEGEINIPNVPPPEKLSTWFDEENEEVLALMSVATNQSASFDRIQPQSPEMPRSIDFDALENESEPLFSPVLTELTDELPPLASAESTYRRNPYSLFKVKICGDDVGLSFGDICTGNNLV